MTTENAIIPSSLEDLCPLNSHPMQVHSKSGTVQPRINPSLLLAHMELKGVKETALWDPKWFAVSYAKRVSCSSSQGDLVLSSSSSL